MSEEIPTEAEELAKALLVPCATKEQLRDWIKCYLGLDFPDAIVYENSTTSPMDAIWYVYDCFRCRRFDLPGKWDYADIEEIMAYAARDSYKTLGAAVLEVVVLLHMSLSVAHMAAQEKQSKKAQQYVKGFFDKPFLRDYVTVRNETRIEVTRYDHRESGLVITKEAFDHLPPQDQLQYEQKWNYIQVLICTMQGANSEHVPFLVVDEVDVIKGEQIRAYEESKAIPSTWQGTEPITLYISSRKSSTGLVQSELDAAPETGLKVLHWNIIDVAKPCPPERHLPAEPKIPIYYQEPHKQTRGVAISEEDFKLLSDDDKGKYKKTEGYAGCLKNCKLFFACKGALATKQTSDSDLLKSIDRVTKLFRKVAPGMANAQLLCNEPGEEGVIYPNLDREIHLITAAQMAHLITGETYDPNLSKAQLIEIGRENGLDFAAGLDHGDAHNTAITTLMRDTHRAFVIDQQSQSELELDHKIALLTNIYREMKVNPRIWADTEDPGSNRSIKRKGFRIMDWKKGPGSVVHGIEVFRSLISPAVGDPRIYFLKGDEGVEMLFRRLKKYHWARDAANRLTDVPDEYVSKDEMDDECDSCRYVVMNEFGNRGKVVVEDDKERKPDLIPVHKEPTVQNYLTHYIQEALGADPEGDEDEAVSVNDASGRQGGFLWNI